MRAGGMALASVLAALLTAGCPPTPDTGLGPTPTGPALEHVPPGDVLVDGDSVTLAVTASDEDGVAGVRAYHRVAGSDTWGWTDMGGAAEAWSVSLQVEDPGLEYYFKASDGGTPQAVSYLPEEASAAPFAVEVLADALALPFAEDFELDEGQDDVWDLGWVTFQAAFPGYPWALAEGGADGGLRARHALGTGDPDDLMDDWLISPALDFSGADAVGLSWYEQGTAVDLADHGLWLSAGSRDPSVGDYVEVQPLDPPTEGWARAPVVDLSEWAGERVVYLAWRYQGADADTWSVDDVAVGPLGADLTLQVASSPSPVHPGEDVTLRVTVTNSVDVAADAVVLALRADMGDGGLVEQSQDLGTIEALGETAAEFTFTLASSLPDNTVLPCELTLTSGEQTWTTEYALQLGYPSTASLDLTLDAFALVQVALGVGDPDAPTWEEAVFYGTLDAGTSRVEADVTAQNDLLPPAAGEHRWYARVLAYTTGSVAGFALSHGGVGYAADTLPALASGEEVVVWLPEPPDPEIVSWQTSPSALRPGDAGVTFAFLSLTNAGAATSGAVTATLESRDADVTVLDPGPIAVTEGVWEAGGLGLLLGAFAFDVSAAHVDSQDLALVLVLDDGVDRFELPVSVPVPWPVLRITRVDVDDGAGGDGDGVLDPDESATLELTVANTGDLDTDGIVRGSLALLGTSTATADVPADSESFGSIAAGSSRSEEFDVAVLSGDLGYTLDLQLQLEDGMATYTPGFQLALGEPPWLAARPVDDATGDALDAYAFDWLNVWYRTNGGMIELRLVSSSGFSLSSVFLEGWGTSAGAGYVLYQLVIQGGTADLLGWPDYSSHSVIGTASLSAYGSDELLLSWDPACMDLALDQFSMGFGAGWCGPPEYYCDHFPDGWGYPYEGYDSGSWLDFEW